MEGRTADERDDGRRGRAAARVPRHPRTRGHGAGRRVDPLAAARRRLVEQLLRRAGRSLDDYRGIRRAPSRRRQPRSRAHARRRGVCSRAGRARTRARLHPHLAGDVRRVAVAAGAGATARADAAAVLGAALDLRLRLLGAPDRRGAVDRAGAAADADAPFRTRRAARLSAVDAREGPHGDRAGARARRPCARGVPAGRGAAAPRSGAFARGALDRAPAGGRRLVGRHPAAVGLLADRPAPARIPDRPPADEGRPRRPGALHDRGRAQPPPGGVPVAGLGHGARDRRARRRGHAGRRSGARAGRRLADRRTDPDQRRLGGAPAGAAPGRLVVRVRQRLLPRRRRHRRGRAWRCCASNTPTRSVRIERAHRLAGGDAGPRRRLGRVRRRQHEAHAARPAVLRLRRGDRPAERRRHRARAWRCSPRSGRSDTDAARRGTRWLAGTSRSRRAPGSGAGASTTSTGPARPCRRSSPPASRPARSRSAAPCAGSRTIRTPTAAGARTLAPTSIPPPIGRGAEHRIADRLGAARAARRGRALTGGAPRRPLPHRDPARRTAAGTSRSTPAPASPATSTSTITSTGSCSRSWRWRAAHR